MYLYTTYTYLQPLLVINEPGVLPLLPIKANRCQMGAVYWLPLHIATFLRRE